MSKFHAFMQQKRHLLYVQLAFTVLAFMLMGFFSYLFASNLVHHYMVIRAENIVDIEQMKIEADLREPNTALGIFSESVREMIVNGDGNLKLKNFFDQQSDYLRKKKKANFVNIKGFYGYFENHSDEPIFISGTDWIPPEDYIPSERPWYHTAIEALGEISESKPYTDKATGNIVISYSRSIYSEGGHIIGVVSLDVLVSEIGKYIIDTALAQGGYGILLSQDLTVLDHPNKPFVGLVTGDPVLPISLFEKELRNGEDIYERNLISFDKENTIAFFKKLSNGWYLGLLTPKGPYYRDVTKIAIRIGLIGLVFAAILILILIRIDAARRKSDMESRHKSIFLANMSHEIRTPMNAIIGMAAIGRSTENIKRKNYCLSKIDNASQHLLGVINDILDMSKIEANKFALAPVEFNFERMLQRTITVVNFRMDEKQHKFMVYVDNNIPKTLFGDEQRLAQVITNLLGNAAKFTNDRGTISLNASLLSEKESVCTIQVTVKDTGIGISPEQQEKLFKSFQQADANTTRKYGGTGLGLAISKNIVEMMGGSIWVKSESGKGSTFGFTVNLMRGTDETPDANPRQPFASLDHESFVKNSAEDTSEDPDSPSSETLKNDTAGIFAGRRILLVEDVEINREIIRALLENTQVIINCAENGAEAVRTFSNNPEKYDLILMDLQMPEMDGYDATRNIRALEADLRKKTTGTKSTAGKTQSSNSDLQRQIPIIAMTANVFREDIEKCLETGMNDHIGKPLDSDELFEKLRFYLL